MKPLTSDIVRIAAAQYPISQHRHFADWQQHVRTWVAQAATQGAELLVFPEYSSMELVSLLSDSIQQDIQLQVQQLQPLLPEFCAVFESLARQYGIVVVAPSFPVVEDAAVYNRAFVFSAKGLVSYQDKFFMTRFEAEEWGVASAPKRLRVFETNWGCFGIQICYDVEFPLGSQWLAQAGATLILAPSCTETIRGATRVHVGARARALENQCYTLVAQTIGEAPWSPAVDLNYGFAACYCPPDRDLPPEGIVAQLPPQQAGWLITSVSLSALDLVRTDGQVFNYQDTQRTRTALQNEGISVQRIIV